MRRYWEIDQTFAQPSESLLKKNLKESVKKQKEKGNKLEPVVISGRAIAKSWWGKAWCDNLEHYAVYRALKARNQQQAVKDICIHIVNQQDAILRSLEQMNKEERPK